MQDPVQNSPSTGPSSAHPVQNSPSTPKNANFGHFFACRANIVTLAAQPSRAGRKLSPTGHGNTSVLKEKSPLHEVLRAVVKHFSPMHVHKSHFWPISTEHGRYFFHCGCMPSTGAIRWGDISFRTRPRPPTEPPILTRRNRHQQPGGADVMRAEGLGGHSTAAVGAAEPESTRAPSPTRLEATAGPAWPAGPGHGAGGRRRGLAGLRGDAPSHPSASQAPLVWRAPEGPEGTGGLRGAAPNDVRRPSLGGGGGLRRPEHPWGHKQQHTGTNGERAGRRPRAHKAAWPHSRIRRRPEHQRRNKHRHRKRKAYSPRNALIAGISRTACTRPAR